MNLYPNHEPDWATVEDDARRMRYRLEAVYDVANCGRLESRRPRRGWVGSISRLPSLDWLRRPGFRNSEPVSFVDPECCA